MPEAPTTTNSAAKKLCFVIGPIGEKGSDIRRLADFLLDGLIREALRSPDLNFEVKRADEDPRPGMINDRVIIDIIKADLVIADLTHLNPNALYELGIRHSSRLPTVHIAAQGTKLPFDNLGHSAIFIDTADWSDIKRARVDLEKAVRSTMVDGYIVSNPVTQANAAFEMTKSADPHERVVADLVARVADLEKNGKPLLLNENYNPSSADLAAFRSLLGRELKRIGRADTRAKSLNVKETIENLAISAGVQIAGYRVYPDVAMIDMGSFQFEVPLTS
jgi:hypothetical protein